MINLLNDKQIAKAETSVRKIISGMAKGKIAINWRDFKRHENTKQLYTCGSVTSRQMLRVITDLKHYKKHVEELRKGIMKALLQQSAEDAYHMLRKLLQDTATEEEKVAFDEFIQSLKGEPHDRTNA